MKFMNHDEGRQVLLECDDLLTSLDLGHFITLGTALGAYRDNGFTPTERDIDFGILIENLIPNAVRLLSAFEGAGYRVLLIRRPMTKVRAIKVFKGNVHADIAGYLLHGDERFCPSSDPGVKAYAVVYPREILETYDEVTVFGRTFRAPSPIETYLENEYGDWRTPREDSVSRTRVYGYLKQEGIGSDFLDPIEA